MPLLLCLRPSWKSGRQADKVSRLMQNSWYAENMGFDAYSTETTRADGGRERSGTTCNSVYRQSCERRREAEGRDQKAHRAAKATYWYMGPYIKDVRKIFGILDPLPPPCPHFYQTYKSKSTQPPLLCLLLGYPPPPLLVRTSFMYGP